MSHMVAMSFASPVSDTDCLDLLDRRNLLAKRDLFDR